MGHYDCRECGAYACDGDCQTPENKIRRKRMEDNRVKWNELLMQARKLPVGNLNINEIDWLLQSKDKHIDGVEDGPLSRLTEVVKKMKGHG